MAYRDRPVKGLPVASMANRVNAARTLIAHYCHHRERSEAISDRLGTSIQIAALRRTKWERVATARIKKPREVLGLSSRAGTEPA
jgi:hypothetical protein